MDTIKYIKEITTDTLLIDHLEKYKGQKVEITITIQPVEAKKHKTRKSLYGMFKQYADPELQDKEDQAWELAMKEKHGNP